jgi:tRNA (cytidine/uridine-2'-O-)-methyltransferase
MFDVVLVAPQIPTNTGNVIRLCANTGAGLHLVEPLGFRLDARSLRRAGLDYVELVDVSVHPGWDEAVGALAGRRLLGFSAAGTRRFDHVRYRPGDVLVFGAEAGGLPAGILGSFPAARRVHLPMRPGNRSLNLANAVAVAVYEAWRQHGFAGAACGDGGDGGGTTAESTAVAPAP